MVDENNKLRNKKIGRTSGSGGRLTGYHNSLTDERELNVPRIAGVGFTFFSFPFGFLNCTP